MSVRKIVLLTVVSCVYVPFVATMAFSPPGSFCRNSQEAPPWMWQSGGKYNAGSYNVPKPHLPSIAEAMVMTPYWIKIKNLSVETIIRLEALKKWVQTDIVYRDAVVTSYERDYSIMHIRAMQQDKKKAKSDQDAALQDEKKFIALLAEWDCGCKKSTADDRIQRLKNEALRCAYKTNDATMWDYLNRRNNLAAGLYSGGDPCIIQREEKHAKLLPDAAMHGDTELVELLLRCGADVHEKSIFGYAIDQAHNVEIAQLLIARDALKNPHAHPLHHAMRYGYAIELTPLYTTHGCSPFDRDKYDNTPLMSLAIFTDQSLPAVQEKAQRLLEDLTLREIAALITTQLSDGRTVFDFLKNDRSLMMDRRKKAIDWLYNFLEDQLHMAQLLSIGIEE